MSTGAPYNLWTLLYFTSHVSLLLNAQFNHVKYYYYCLRVNTNDEGVRMRMYILLLGASPNEVTLPPAIVTCEFGLIFGLITIISILMSMLSFSLLPISLPYLQSFHQEACVVLNEWQVSICDSSHGHSAFSSEWRERINRFDVFIYKTVLGLSKN